jgi:imidazolonepropionase-like amidohydrolase
MQQPERIGLIDTHVHIRSAEAFAQLKQAGIVAVRDAGMKENAESNSRSEPEIAGVIVRRSLWGLYKKGSYGSRFGIGVETAAEIAAEIKKLRQDGADFIKIMASGIVDLADPVSVTAGGFSQDELAIIVKEAADARLPVMAHANGEEAIIAAARAGVRSIEHGFFMTERALNELAEHSVYWVPTVGALARAAGRAGDAETRERAHRLIESHKRMIRKALDAGVRIAVGTDCILPDAGYRQAYEDELRHLSDAGLSREEVETASREVGAELLGLARG